MVPESASLRHDEKEVRPQPSVPAETPRRSWIGLIRQVFKDFSANRLLSLAASVTYYGLLALFPAIAAVVAIYGLFNDPAAIDKQVQALSSVIPGGAIQVVSDQIHALTSASKKATGITFIGGLLISLWSASSGVKALFDALNVTYGEPERRGFIKLTLIALLFTLGAIVFVMVGLAGTVVVPVVLNALDFRGPLGWIISAVRWVVLLAIIAVALAVIYRYGPSREEPRWQWFSWGGAFAALGWLVVSALFSWYAANFGKFNATYGSLGAVVGLMTWLWLSTTVILLGAQINADLERPAREAADGAGRPGKARPAIRS